MVTICSVFKEGAFQPKLHNCREGKHFYTEIMQFSLWIEDGCNV